MKKKFLTLFVFLLPLVSFAEDNLNNDQENALQEPEATQEVSKEEISFNFPEEDKLNSHLNLSNLPKIEDNDPENAARETFPVETTLGYDLDNSDGKYFLQAKGSDTLNNNRNQEFNFVIKVPYLQQTSSGNALGAIPDVFTFNFIDPFFNITLGDEKYNISSLTMSQYEARGGLINLINKDLFGFSVLYLTKTPTKDKNPADNVGASFFIQPLEMFKISSNFVHTRYDKKIPLNAQKNNYTYSLQSNITPFDLANLELEVGSSNQLEKKNIAYLINLDGKNEVVSYSANWVYANPGFVGKFSDKALLDSSAKYEKNNLLVTAAHKYEKNNLENSSLLESSKREQYSSMNVSYPLFAPMETTIGLNKKSSKDLLNQNGYKVDAINLKTSSPIRKYTLETSLEYGVHRCRIENNKARNWQNIQLFLSKKYSDDNLISVYTKLGNLLYENIYTLSYLAGTNLQMNLNKNFSLSLVYEYSINQRKLSPEFVNDEKMRWRSHYIKQNFSYTFTNEHKITLSGQLNKPLSYKKEKAVSLAYTIPLNVPNVNKALNSIKNRLF